MHVRPFSPSEGRVGFDRKDGSAIGKDRELVILRLLTEDLHAGHRDDTGRDTLLLQDLGGLDSEGNLRSGSDESDGGVGLLVKLDRVETR